VRISFGSNDRDALACGSEENRVNHKKVRVMKENDLMVTQKVYKAKRMLRRNRPGADGARQYRGLDMAKFVISPIGWFYQVGSRIGV
jgi:hypothetical protein